MASPAVSANTVSDVPATSASTPRREIVGAAGSVATRSSSTASGTVSASPVRNSVRNRLERRARTISPNFTQMWIAKPAMNAHAP